MMASLNDVVSAFEFVSASRNRHLCASCRRSIFSYCSSIVASFSRKISSKKRNEPVFTCNTDKHGVVSSPGDGMSNEATIVSFMFV